MTPRKYLQHTFLLLGALLLLQTQRASSASGFVQGERLFQAHCAGCHGPKGEGGSGPTLATLLLSRAPTEDSLFKLIAEGIPGTEMPRSRLDKEQIKQLAAFVRQLGQLPPERVSGDAERVSRCARGATCGRGGRP